MDQIVQFLEPVRQFSKDSIRLVKRCTNPDRKGNESLSYRYQFLRPTANLFNVNYETYMSVSNGSEHSEIK